MKLAEPVSRPVHHTPRKAHPNPALPSCPPGNASAPARLAPILPGLGAIASHWHSRIGTNDVAQTEPHCVGSTLHQRAKVNYIPYPSVSPSPCNGFLWTHVVDAISKEEKGAGGCQKRGWDLACTIATGSIPSCSILTPFQSAPPVLPLPHYPTFSVEAARTGPGQGMLPQSCSQNGHCCSTLHTGRGYFATVPLSQNDLAGTLIQDRIVGLLVLLYSHTMSYKALDEDVFI